MVIPIAADAEASVSETTRSAKAPRDASKTTATATKTLTTISKAPKGRFVFDKAVIASFGKENIPARPQGLRPNPRKRVRPLEDSDTARNGGLEKAQATRETQESELQQLQETVTELRAAVAKLHKQREEDQAAIQNLRGDITDLRVENEQLLAKITGVKATIEGRKERNPTTPQPTRPRVQGSTTTPAGARSSTCSPQETPCLPASEENQCSATPSMSWAEI